MQAHDDKLAGRGVRTRQYNPYQSERYDKGSYRVVVWANTDAGPWHVQPYVNNGETWISERGKYKRKELAIKKAKDWLNAQSPSGSIVRTANPKPDSETGLHVEYLPANQAYAVMWHDHILNIVNTRGEAGEIVKDLKRKNPGAINLAQYVQAAMEHSRGAHDAGGRVIHDTPKAKRREFALEIWWRRGYRNPRGRAPGELEVIDKSPHTEVGYEPHSKHLPDKCGNCANLIQASPLRCLTVKNPIGSVAWCERYSARGENPSSRVWQEWKAGTLRTSAGDLVPRGKAGEAQARAILLSELRREGRIGPRQNPSGSADELYRKFHGVHPDNHLVFDVPLVDPYGSHPEITQFGLLVRLVVGEGVEVKGSQHSDDFFVRKIAHDAWAREICFIPSLGEYKRMVRNLRTQSDVDQMKSWLRKKGTPDLAGAPDGSQIYIVGGNQDVSADLSDLGADARKERLDLGFCYMVEYFTQKRFDQMSPIDYYHAFGEKSHVQPRLIFWRKIPLLELAGGEYTVKPAGITN